MLSAPDRQPAASHRYQVGRPVRFRRAAIGCKVAGVSRDTFRIVRLLPIEHGAPQYRIQSTRDNHERVVSEAEIADDFSSETADPAAMLEAAQ